MKTFPFFCLLLIFLTSALRPCEGQSQNPENYAPDRLIAKISKGIPLKQGKEGNISLSNPATDLLFRQIGLTKIIPLAKGQKHINQYRLPVLLEFKTGVNLANILPTLKLTGVFDFVEPDFISTGQGGTAVCSTIPDDNYFYRQWGLYNNGSFNGNSVNNADTDMDKAWEITTGSPSIVVSILDSGTKTDHPEFNGRIWINTSETDGNGTDEESNGYADDVAGWDFVNNDNNPKDDHGHGTNVSGIVGATGNNGIGYAGVDWNCKLMICKVLGANNSGANSGIISAIYYSVDNGADVINLSLGGPSYSAAMDMAVNYAHDHNVAVVAAMMNNNSSVPYYPAAYTNSIAVGATDTDNKRASFSSFGPHIDLVAPGRYIYGLSYTSNTDYNVYWNGTSQATPLVSGTIALVKSIAPSLNVDSIRSLLHLGSQDQVGNPTEDTPGKDDYYGYGLLNAQATLMLAQGKNPSCQFSAPFTENFEATSPSSHCWENEYTTGNEDWNICTGSSGAISSAHGGNQNARFVSKSSGPHITRFVSPAINTSGLAYPELHFWYAQEDWGGDQNYLKVYSRVSPGNSWSLLWSDSTNQPAWNEAVVSLPGKGPAYQIAFEGIDNFGYPNVIDDISIVNGCTSLQIPSLSLVNASSFNVIDSLSNGYTIDKSSLPDFSVRAEVCDAAAVGSVRFFVNGSLFRNENLPPYTIEGDNSHDYTPWKPTAGNYTLTATAYSYGNGNGSAGPSKTVYLSVIDSVPRADCNGEMGGSAYTNECGICVEGSTGQPADSGKDDCGVCGGHNADKDCNGECFGTASIDSCGDCSGGSTGLAVNGNCSIDCNGDVNGTASVDSCGVCSGGNTGLMANSAKDTCGVCFGNNLSCAACPPVGLASLSLMHAGTGGIIRLLNETDTIIRSQTGNFSLRADVCSEPDVESVAFYLNDSTIKKENVAPYSIAGDVGGNNYYNWNISPGHYNLEVIPYPGNNANGTPGYGKSVDLWIFDAAPAPSMGGPVSHNPINARVSAKPGAAAPGSTSIGQPREKDEIFLDDQDEMDGLQLKVYPNPTSANCFIEVFNTGEEADLMLLNASGKLLQHSHSECLAHHLLYKVEMKDLPEGIYLIKVRTGGHFKTQRIVKS